MKKQAPRPTASPIRDPAGSPRKSFYVTIPSGASFTDEDRAVYDGGGYPLHVSPHLREHESFADFLVERSLEAWTRSRG
jgi:hypothetical protein